VKTDRAVALQSGLRANLRGLPRRPLIAAFLLLGVLAGLRVILDPSLLDVAILGLVVAIAIAVVRERASTEALEGARRGEAESFARVLRGLSRSVSPDAIVDAIVEEVGEGTGADYVAVVRRRPEARLLEAVLSPTRSGAAASRTTMSLRELEDPAQEQAMTELSIAASRGRRLAAIPIDPDPGGDPGLPPLGLWTRPAGGRPGEPPGAPQPALVHVPSEAGNARGRRAKGRRSVHATPTAEGVGQRIADRIAARLQDTYGLSNTRAAPLRVNGRVEGAIVLARRKGAPWPASADGFLNAAAIEASAALARVYSLRDAEARATTDALTGLPNRRYFDEYVGLLGRRRRAEDRVGVLMVDIDRFKTLNDTFGHAVGDHVLREVAGAIAGSVREGDVPARFGGEEFAVLLRNPSPEVAVEVGERVRRAVGALDLRHMGVPGVSVSVGVAIADEPDVPLEAVIDDADRALYRAKRGGRDRVVAA
jgi:diguanylate cyclase (GGDEF)-like protein